MMGNSKMLPIDADNINAKIAQIDTFHKIQKTIFRSKIIKNENYKIQKFKKTQNENFRIS
jgi:ribosomal protein S6